MPQRVDMAPEDFPLHLPGILLVDVEGLDQQGRGVFRYRVVGTREVRLRGHDPTGKLVQDGFFGLSAKDTIDRYEQVRRDRTLLYDPHEYYTQEGKWQEGVTLFLPISEDGETVSQVLVYAENRLPQPGDDLAGLGFSPLRAGND